MRQIPKIKKYLSVGEFDDIAYIKALEQWAKEAEDKIKELEKDLKDAIKIIRRGKISIPNAIPEEFNTTQEIVNKLTQQDDEKTKD